MIDAKLRENLVSQSAHFLQFYYDVRRTVTPATISEDNEAGYDASEILKLFIKEDPEIAYAFFAHLLAYFIQAEGGGGIVAK